MDKPLRISSDAPCGCPVSLALDVGTNDRTPTRGVATGVGGRSYKRYKQGREQGKITVIHYVYIAGIGQLVQLLQLVARTV